MPKYKHLFIDLDRTLWDFDKNAMDALEEIFHKHKLGNHFSGPEEFIQLYHLHNERLWQQYRDGNIKKEVLRYKRFDLTLAEKKIKNKFLSSKIGEDYLLMSVQQTRLFPNTHEVLKYLQPKYSLYILTNGFRETQFSKLRNCDLEKYFEKIFTSETIGYNKPHPKIFQWAVSSVNAKKEDCLMIGDDQAVDIKGAADFGMDTVFFNPANEVSLHPCTYMIKGLIELKQIL
jgi:putative hydrolase of the HAD superfamily